MKKVIWPLNWSMLGLCFIAIAIASRRHLNIPAISTGILMIPFAIALVALKSRETVAITMSGLFANGIYALIGFGGLLYSLSGKAALPLEAGIASLIVCIPCAMNSAFFVQTLQRLAVPPSQRSPDGT